MLFRSTHQFAQFFGKLLLAFGEDALDGDTQKTPGIAGMKQHFDGDPIGEPADESGDEGNQNDPGLHGMFGS